MPKDPAKERREFLEKRKDSRRSKNVEDLRTDSGTTYSNQMATFSTEQKGTKSKNLRDPKPLSEQSEKATGIDKIFKKHRRTPGEKGNTAISGKMKDIQVTPGKWSRFRKDKDR